MSEIKRFEDVEAMADSAAAHIVELASGAIDRTGRFTIALSGGSTPQLTYQRLASQHATQLDWSRVHVFWGDERCVPSDHEDSNYRMASETLLGRVSIPEDNVHRIHAELEPTVAAEEYEQTLRDFFGSHGLQPRFDLALSGLGADGHTASLFPGTSALDETERWVVANYVPKLDSWRITLTATAINAAQKIVFLVSGNSKAEPLREAINGPYQPQHLPVQLIEPIDGTLLWMVDNAAAARL